MPDADGAGPEGPLGIIAGKGTLPRRIAERRAEAGRETLLIVFPGCHEPWMDDFPHQHHAFERAGALFRALRAGGVHDLVFAGAMVRPRLRWWRLDLKAITVFARALWLLRQGDDGMLRGFAAIFESEGIRVIGPEAVLGAEITAGPGAIAGAAPGAEARRDAARAAAIVAALAPFDVGQGAVVARGLCLGVEALEGTDLMLDRIASIPAARRDAARGGVLYKGPKAGQDLRMDRPAIGPDTVARAREAGLDGIVVLAGGAMVLDADGVRRAAAKAGLFVYAATQEELSAWGRA